MKQILFLLIPVFLFQSCLKDDSYPLIETITRGSKWGIAIGSSPEAVYQRLQSLGAEKEFVQVSVVSRKPYASPQAIEQQLPFYHGLTLQSSAVVIERTILQFPQDIITSISVGGALPVDMPSWPGGVPDAIVIHENDAVSGLYSRLVAIHELPDYKDYQFILPEKPLAKGFDPDMANYEQWAFNMSGTPEPGRGSNSLVRLFFKDRKLHKIVHEYNESEVVN